MRRAAILLLAPLACHEPAHNSAPWRAVADVDVDEPWQVVQQDDDVVALRFSDTPHGVRVFLGPSARWDHAGASPVVDGETVGLPMVGVPTAVGPAKAVSIRSEAHDLLVRFSSQPLDTLTNDPAAPADPALTWIRLRPRNGSWRIVLDGLGDLNLPAHTAQPSDAGIRLSGPSGVLDVRSEAPEFTSSLVNDTWRLSTLPSVDVRAPYSRTAFTWSPDQASP